MRSCPPYLKIFKVIVDYSENRGTFDFVNNINIIMSKCLIKSCKNRSQKNPNIRFFRFPKNEVLLSKWVAACEEENVNVRDGRICSVHFSATAFKDLSHLGHSRQTKTRLLKSDAVPTLNLNPLTSQSEQVTSSATTRYDESITISSAIPAANDILAEKQMEASTSKLLLKFECDESMPSTISTANNILSEKQIEASTPRLLLKFECDESIPSTISAANNILPENQMEVSMSRHLLNFDKVNTMSEKLYLHEMEKLKRNGQSY
ncbi:THAP domain-containing protein 1 isoform X3 [Monomorium pharaonis]|uniref:THAP domain-containing protein 1 isoform X3 n=1 Tax=Monomorium pharaonis TaxID=307658 RepID=UPI00063F8D06|nr:THAP domain-containing protein 1 isoform X3 [Monomorium pharaonis]